MGSKILRPRLGAIVAVSMLAGGLMGSTAMAIQGHMFAARNELERAGAQLQAALPDKAGHRVAAIRDVNAALGEVNAGISAGAE